MAEYDLNPVDVPKIETKYRTINTKIPVPESIPIYQQTSKNRTQINDGTTADRVVQSGGFNCL